MEYEAEIDWEYQRALGLLPPEETKPAKLPGSVEVFFSYSHKDEKHRDALATHLAQLKNEGLIREWHDRKIGAGREGEAQIAERLDSAHVMLLLVSADFLCSQFCYSVEMNQAVERHNKGEARVIPIILRACDWHSAPFGKLQALPKDAKPVTSWKKKDEALTNVAKSVRAAVIELVGNKQ